MQSKQEKEKKLKIKEDAKPSYSITSEEANPLEVVKYLGQQCKDLE